MDAGDTEGTEARREMDHSPVAMLMVQAQKHLRLPGKRMINNSAHHVTNSLGRKRVSLFGHDGAQLQAQTGGMGEKTQLLARPWNRELRDPCFCGHHSPGSQQSPSASGCGKGIPMPGDAR